MTNGRRLRSLLALRRTRPKGGELLESEMGFRDLVPLEVREAGFAVLMLVRQWCVRSGRAVEVATRRISG